MATTVNKFQDLVLDDKTYKVRPLKIKSLREFMKAMAEVSDLEDEQEILDGLTSAAQLAFNSCNKDLPEGFDFEDEVDFEDVKVILKVCGGVDLDANLRLATA